MKRLVMGMGTLVLAAQLAGCGGDGSSTGTATGPPVKNSENPNLPPEVREYESKTEANISKVMEKAQAQQKKTP